MKAPTADEKLIINEWRKRQTAYDEAKKELKGVLDRYGIASQEFKTARLDFEMIKEEFDNFENEHRKVLADYR